MRDFNFFEAFEQKKKRGDGPRIAYPLVLVLVVLAAAAWPAYNFFQLYQLNNSIAEHEQRLVTDPRYPLFEEVEQKEAELAEEQRILASLEASAEEIHSREVIDELLLFTIVSSMPEDTAMNSMNISGRNITVNGVARSKPAIAEFEYNIRNTERFERIFIPSISESGDMWQFNMAFSLKEGDVE
ncbi:MAG: PilN domain-containing protein [Bacillota bacterium]|nr:PilN domain-containing protein [Bacillota bacterium]